jgi:hypothetical protein
MAKGQRCRLCGEAGHNRRGCKSVVAASAPSPPEPRPAPAAFAKVPPPPADDPLKLAEWCCRVQAICLDEVIRGRGDPALAREVRELAAGIARLIPADILSRAKRKISEATSPKRATKQRKGPRPTPVTDGGNHRTGREPPLRR